MRPEDYYYSCPKDLFRIAAGYQERIRGEWHRFALVAKALGADIDVDAAFDKGRPKRTKIRSREDFNEFLQRFPSHRKEKDGPGASRG